MIDAGINQIRTTVKDFRYSVDVSQEYFDRMSAKQVYADFLRHKMKNSTRANIAMEEISRKYPCMFPVSYEQNLKSLEKSPKIDTLIKKLNGIKSELYPKTGSLRERLVAAGRVTFDEVKPVLKGLKKQLLKIHVAI